MKSFTGILSHIYGAARFILLSAMILQINCMIAQEKPSIKGNLLEQKTSQAVPYAAIGLIRVSDSVMITGTMSDDKGAFSISPVVPGNYRLRVSTIGYKPAVRNITVITGVTDAGTIFLQDTAMQLKEVAIVSDRVKARSESDRTTYFMTKKLLDATSTGMDVLKQIPGIQVDFNQNISLEGSRNIQVFVDGRERDASFLGQLDPGQIERVEVISKPTANYDGNTTGAINIILKKERYPGISGQIYAEIPASLSEVYIRPNFNLNLGFKKLNFYTTYKGEMTYLDLHESTVREIRNGSANNEVNSAQDVRQKDWSHRFNFGIDYFAGPRDQLNLYGFYNPYSRELDGNAASSLSGSINKSWQARKEDTDRNTGTFYSLYYKHNFKKDGSELAIEISNYSMNAKNSTAYSPEGNENGLPLITNTAEPRQNVLNAKVDFTLRLWNTLDFSTGIKTKYQVLQDLNLPEFKYDEKIYAAYGTLSYKHSRYFLSAGLRAEEAVTSLKNSFTHPLLSLFPNATFNYKLTSRQNLQLSYSRSIRRPGVYQLNPVTSVDDPYTVSKGNPFLGPELRNSFFLEYSIQFKSSYLAARLFYNKLSSVINNLTFLNDTGAAETQVQNLGTISQAGLQFSGTLKLGLATINPFLQVFEQVSNGNALAKQYGIQNMEHLAWNSGLSAILSFKHEISVSVVFQYGSPKYDIQGNSFSDALYFISLDKTFKQKIKIGLVTALPLNKSFTYSGYAMNGQDFSSRYEGKVKISNPFCWLKLSYSFNTGKKKEGIRHEVEEIENLPKKGF